MSTSFHNANQVGRPVGKPRTAVKLMWHNFLPLGHGVSPAVTQPCVQSRVCVWCATYKGEQHCNKKSNRHSCRTQKQRKQRLLWPTKRVRALRALTQQKKARRKGGRGVKGGMSTSFHNANQVGRPVGKPRTAVKLMWHNFLPPGHGVSPAVTQPCVLSNRREVGGGGHKETHQVAPTSSSEDVGLQLLELQTARRASATPRE